MKQEQSHKERTHSVMGGSRAAIYLNCTGYFSIIKDIPPQESSEHAEIGTLFHEMMEIVVEDFLQHKIEGTDPDIRAHLLKKEGVDDEMLSHIEECREAFWVKGLDKHITGKAYALEDRCIMDTIGDIEIGGPIDAWVVYRDKKGQRAGLVVDWKYGYKYVKVEKNLQLLCYAISLREEFKRIGKPLDYVRAAIVQPRADGDLWREVKFSSKDLDKWLEKFRTVAEDVFLHKKIKFKAGDHCTWCPGNGICKTHAEHIQKHSSLKLARQDAELPKPETLNDEQLVKILTYRDDITAFLKGCYSYALRKFKAGGTIEGFKVVEGTAKRKWRSNAEEIGAGLKKHGLSDPFRPIEPELRTITDIEKELKKLKGSKDEADSILQNYTERGSVPEILVPDTDARPSIKTYSDLLD